MQHATADAHDHDLPGWWHGQCGQDHTIADIKFELTKMGVVTDGDFVVHLASMPIADAGMTNMLKLSQV